MTKIDTSREPEYVRAVRVTDAQQVVYAHFHASEQTFFMPADKHIFSGPVWIVWFPEFPESMDHPAYSAEYASFTPEEFNDLFVLESNAPEHVRVSIESFPTYREWCESLHQLHAGVAQ